LQMRTQIATNISLSTRAQADELVKYRGYSIRDVVTVGIRMLYQEEFGMFSKYSVDSKYDYGQHSAARGVLPVGTTVKWPDGETGRVVQHTTSSRHLISRPAPRGSGASETQDWFDLANEDVSVNAVADSQ
jgi:hypothetical protein